MKWILFVIFALAFTGCAPVCSVLGHTGGALVGASQNPPPPRPIHCTKNLMGGYDCQ